MGGQDGRGLCAVRRRVRLSGIRGRQATLRWGAQLSGGARHHVARGRPGRRRNAGNRLRAGQPQERGFSGLPGRDRRAGLRLDRRTRADAARPRAEDRDRLVQQELPGRAGTGRPRPLVRRARGRGGKRGPRPTRQARARHLSGSRAQAGRRARPRGRGGGRQLGCRGRPSRRVRPRAGRGPAAESRRAGRQRRRRGGDRPGRSRREPSVRGLARAQRRESPVGAGSVRRHHRPPRPRSGGRLSGL